MSKSQEAKKLGMIAKHKSKFIEVWANISARNQIIKAQSGEHFENWVDGDLANEQGHSQLISCKEKWKERLYFPKQMWNNTVSKSNVDLLSIQGMMLLIKVPCLSILSLLMMPTWFPIVIIIILRANRLNTQKRPDGHCTSLLHLLGYALAWYLLVPIGIVGAPFILAFAAFAPFLGYIYFTLAVFGVALNSAVVALFLLVMLVGMTGTWALYGTSLGRLAIRISSGVILMLENIWGTIVNTSPTFARLMSSVFPLFLNVFLWGCGLCFAIFMAFIWLIPAILLLPVSVGASGVTFGVASALIFPSVPITVPLWFTLSPIYYSVLMRGQSLLHLLCILCPLHRYLWQARMHPGSQPLVLSENLAQLKSDSILQMDSAPEFLKIKKELLLECVFRLSCMCNRALKTCLSPGINFISFIEINADRWQKGHEDDFSYIF